MRYIFVDGGYLGYENLIYENPNISAKKQKLVTLEKYEKAYITQVLAQACWKINENNVTKVLDFIPIHYVYEYKS